jgi:CheY-like chemotaxis protein
VGQHDPLGDIDSRVGALADLHVLVVEDDRDGREILAVVLRYFGALVTAVPDAEAALRHLRTIIPDIVLTDMQLPDRDGAWLAREALSYGLRVPFIAVSAHDFDERVLAREGFEAYLRKPIDHVRLVDLILAFARRGTWGSGAA